MESPEASAVTRFSLSNWIDALTRIAHRLFKDLPDQQALNKVGPLPVGCWCLMVESIVQHLSDQVALHKEGGRPLTVGGWWLVVEPLS